MRRAALPILLMGIGLVGCTHSPSDYFSRSSSDYWYRAQSTPDQATTDERACRDEATQVARARSREDAHLLEDRSSPSDPGSATIYSSDLNINRYEQLADAERTSIRDLTRACMADHGYRLKHDDD